MFYINFLFITQSLIEVTVLQAMLFKNFDKFSSVLHFSTLKLFLFSCRKSLRFFSARILKLCVFPQKCAWKTQNADQKLSLLVVDKLSVSQLLVRLLNNITYSSAFKWQKVYFSISTQCNMIQYIYSHISFIHHDKMRNISTGTKNTNAWQRYNTC